ncbi:MAG: hypothetical protein U9R14_02895 [Patescibacteria group bacterium]|nr:hypothetical protein [Patescibacteria group bacterium]
MKYIELIKKIKDPIFSLQDLKLLNLQVYPYQLSMWTKKGYLIKIKNGLYALSENNNTLRNEYIAFNLYQPSYVSLEWALSKYGLIPEMVYNCVSVTTKATRTFQNSFGLFVFRHIKKELFFGYKKINDNGQVYLIAEPEKALFDYLYLNLSKIKNQADVDELRLNEFEIKKLNKSKIKKFASLANNKKLDLILKLILK